MIRRRILLLHEQSEAGQSLEGRLTALGYDVVGTAANDDRAASAVATSPDLVVVDLSSVVFDTTESVGERELRALVDLQLCRHDAARASHELDGFFSVAIDMFCFLDFRGYFKRLNPAWQKTLGFTQAELMARPFIDFVHPDDRERTLAQNAKVRGGGQARSFENRYLCKDGSFRWLLWNSTPRPEEGVIYAVARDITERRQADDERARLMRQLEATLAEVKTLQEILPICSYCRKIRDDENYWHSVEEYISEHTRSRFSHGICPDCMISQVEPYFSDETDTDNR